MRNGIVGIFAVLVSELSFALPFNIYPTPGTSLPIAVPVGQSVPASYTVMNNTTSQRNANFVKWLPPYTSIDASSTCTLGSFSLGPKGSATDSCILNLTISGPIQANDPNPHHHLFVCFPGGKTCAGPTERLDVAATTNNFLTRVASGRYVPTGLLISQPLTYYSLDNGNSWTPSIPPPQGSLTNTSILVSTSCAGESGKYCVTVGNYRQVGGTVNNPLTYYSTDGGITWTPSIPPPQGDPATNSSTVGVSCRGDRGQYCIIVGSYVPVGALASSPLAYKTTDGGHTWTFISSMTRHGIAIGGSSLARISCNGDTGQYCTAVGTYTPATAGITAPIAYTTVDGGITWTESFPTTPLADPNRSSTLVGISCNNNGQDCTGAGTYTPMGSTVLHFATFVTFDRANTWIPSIPAIPAGVDPTLTSQFLGVSCAGNRGQYCNAVGTYLPLPPAPSVQAPISFYSVDSGLHWTPVFPPRIGSNTLSSFLAGVHCTGSVGQYCTADGVYDSTFPLVYVSTDGGVHWSSPSVPPPLQGTSSFLAGIGGAG